MNKIPLLIGLIFVVIISGCSSQQAAPTTCGNNAVDAGEECDNSKCPGDKVCTKQCKCETDSLLPPSLPD